MIICLYHRIAGAGLEGIGRLAHAAAARAEIHHPCAADLPGAQQVDGGLVVGAEVHEAVAAGAALDREERVEHEGIAAVGVQSQCGRRSAECGIIRPFLECGGRGRNSLRSLAFPLRGRC